MRAATFFKINFFASLFATFLGGCTQNSTSLEEAVNEEEALAYVDEVDANDTFEEFAINEDELAQLENQEVETPNADDVVEEFSIAEDDSHADNLVADYRPEEDVVPLTTTSDEPSTGSYIVRPGDTLSEIAFKVLGTSKRWKELAEFNNLDQPGRIFPGDEIKYPAEQEEQIFADAKEQVTVQKGDSLASISKALFGTQKAWKYLWRLNEGVVPNPNQIYAGQVLNYFPIDRAVAH